MEGANARHVKWNIEYTASLMHRKFPQSLVFVIKANRMHLNTFSVYSNFVESNDFGCPIHDSAYGALKHLRLLYKSACIRVADTAKEQSTNITGNRDHGFSKQKRVEGMTQCETECLEYKGSGAGCTTESIPLTVIGFSKGCVVLNQLVYEIPYAIQYDCEVKKFLLSIKNLYWLDGGHSGGDVQMSNQHAYITEPHLLKPLAELGCHIHIHVTPYQVHDPLRPWIGKHYRQFCKLLHNTKTSFTKEVHFEREPGSLENHFKILEAFKT